MPHTWWRLATALFYYSRRFKEVRQSFRSFRKAFCCPHSCVINGQCVRCVCVQYFGLEHLLHTKLSSSHIHQIQRWQSGSDGWTVPISFTRHSIPCFFFVCTFSKGPDGRSSFGRYFYGNRRRRRFAAVAVFLFCTRISHTCIFNFPDSDRVFIVCQAHWTANRPVPNTRKINGNTWLCGQKTAIYS